MVKAGKSFADKVRKSAEKERKYSVTKYVKSVVSEKTGQYRFQETILKVPAGMSLADYLKDMGRETGTSEQSDEEAVVVPEVESPEDSREPEQKLQEAEASEKKDGGTEETEPPGEEESEAEEAKG